MYDDVAGESRVTWYNTAPGWLQPHAAASVGLAMMLPCTRVPAVDMHDARPDFRSNTAILAPTVHTDR